MKRYEVDHQCRVFFNPDTGNPDAEIRLYADGDIAIHTLAGGIPKRHVQQLVDWVVRACEDAPDPREEF